MFSVPLLRIIWYSELTSYFEGKLSKTSYYDIFPFACAEENMFATVKKIAVLICKRWFLSKRKERYRESRKSINERLMFQ